MAIKVINIKQQSKEWYDFRRTNGIGSSEVASILGTNEYQTVFNVFSNKVGLNAFEDKPNEMKHWGKKLETQISDSWEFYDGKYTGDKFVPNYVIAEERFIREREEARIRGEKIDKKKYVYRECSKSKGIIVNEKYGWLFLSPDRIIPKGQRKLTDGSVNNEYGYLEIKKINFFAARLYKKGYPDAYDAQMRQALIVMGIGYGEMAMLNDSHLKVYPFEWEKEMAQKIIELTHEFWYGNVIPAREVYNRIKIADEAGEHKAVMEELWAEFHQYEPEPTLEENFGEYVNSTRPQQIGDSLIGDDTALDYARNYQILAACQRILAKAQNLPKNKLIDIITKEQVGEIFFKELNGWVRYKPDANGSKPKFRVSDKITPTEEKIIAALGELNFDGMYEDK